jgi:thioredoxin-related protein
MEMRKLAGLMIASGLILLFISFSTESQNIDWKTYGEGIQLSKSTGKPVFLYLYSETCSVCRLMSSQVLSDSTVSAKIDQEFIPVRVDVNADTDVVRKFIFVFKEKGEDFVVPTFVIMDSDENIIRIKSGYIPKEDFLIFIS